MGEPLDLLGPAERRAIDDAFAPQDPPAGAAMRVRSRLEAVIPEMRPRSDAGANAPSLGRWRGGIGWPIATFFLGAVVGVALSGSLGSGPPNRHDEGAPSASGGSTLGRTFDRTPNNPTAATGSGAARESSLYEAGAPAAPILRLIPPSAGAGSAGKSPASHDLSASPASSQLNAERRVLDLARSALVAEDPNEALRRVGDHLARFPNGFLSEEREAIAIQALVKAARYDEARARARLFHVRSPDSLFASAVDSAIHAIP
jgi:hypothetical protein